MKIIRYYLKIIENPNKIKTEPSPTHDLEDLLFR